MRDDPTIYDVAARELMLRVARRPRFCGCCYCLDATDRKRARRVFRLVRAVMRQADTGRQRPAAAGPA